MMTISLLHFETETVMTSFESKKIDVKAMKVANSWELKGVILRFCSIPK
jgi:hypothetical protein